jgi:hypothetical protein
VGKASRDSNLQGFCLGSRASAESSQVKLRTYHSQVYCFGLFMRAELQLTDFLPLFPLAGLGTPNRTTWQRPSQNWNTASAPSNHGYAFMDSTACMYFPAQSLWATGSGNTCSSSAVRIIAAEAFLLTRRICTNKAPQSTESHKCLRPLDQVALVVSWIWPCPRVLFENNAAPGDRSIRTEEP